MGDKFRKFQFYPNHRPCTNRCIGPVHIALVGLVQELYWGEQALGFLSWDGEGEAEVRALEVVPGEVAQEFEVEVGEVVEEEQVVVVVDAFFLDGAIEAFAVGVHARGFGEGMPVGGQAVGERGGEMALELAAVVGEDGFDGEGEDGLDQAEELGGGGAGVAVGGPGPGEVRVQIGAGDDVAASALGLQLDAVQGHAMAGALGVEMFGFAQARLAYRAGLAVGDEAPWAGAHLIGRVGDQAADGTRAGTGQLSGGGEGQQQQVELLFGQIRVRGA
jgi:hypothetical protein